MRLIATAATALLAALAPTTSAAQAAAPTPSGSVRIFEIRNEGGDAVTVVGSVRCRSNDNVTLKVMVSQTVSPNGDEPAPFGESSTTVTCTPNIEDRFMRVPILRDGPVTPGRMMVVATDMYNSAGRRIDTSNTMLPIY
ncbi:hypothetical protein [Nonomuraea dietziae]|uniref:hypothetical protein n=1 Tax=Nonomuraea dietziae TaxID=65515 RepID=UPI0033D07D69